MGWSSARRIREQGHHGRAGGQAQPFGHDGRGGLQSDRPDTRTRSHPVPFDLEAEGIEATESMFERGAMDEGAAATPDLEQALHHETGERLPDGRATDTVASHELLFGLDLGARLELTPRDALPQIELDLPVEGRSPCLDRHDDSSWPAHPSVPRDPRQVGRTDVRSSW